jgi:hypothetical protein
LFRELLWGGSVHLDLRRGAGSEETILRWCNRSSGRGIAGATAAIVIITIVIIIIIVIIVVSAPGAIPPAVVVVIVVVTGENEGHRLRPLFEQRRERSKASIGGGVHRTPGRYSDHSGQGRRGDE